MHLLVPVKSQGKSCRSIVPMNRAMSLTDAFRTQTQCNLVFYARMKATDQVGLSRDQSDSSSMLVTAAVQKRLNAYHDRSVIA